MRGHDVLVGNEGRNQLFMKEKARLVDVKARSPRVRSDETRKIWAADGDLAQIVANVRFGMPRAREVTA
jgi:hypothetical protein